MLFVVKSLVHILVPLKNLPRMSPSKYYSSLRVPLSFITQQNDIPLEARTLEFCHQYVMLPIENKLDVLKELAQKYDFDQQSSRRAAESYVSLKDKGVGVQLKAADRLKTALSPKYSFAFNRIRKLDGGVKFLVDLREDIMKLLPSLDFNDEATDRLKSLNAYLKEILAFSFNVGFLKLERITWDSSCLMLEKISEYEAVHPVRNWTDIKQRVGPYRRCYVFTHSSMPKEPIVVLHTALTDDIPSSVASIVKHKSTGSESNNISGEMEDPQNIQAAIFYSITSTQKGLHGIELGNQLIKKVVREVLAEFPHISKLSSLSPIPGLRDWFLMELQKMKIGNSIISSFFTESDVSNLKNIFPGNEVWNSLQSSIASNHWVKNENLKDYLRVPLMKACTHYLYNEKRRANALNSVAHFHLRNGAVMWRLNWSGDLSPRGLSHSCGMMVNYRYYLDETEPNSKNYLENHVISVSEHFKKHFVTNSHKACL